MAVELNPNINPEIYQKIYNKLNSFLVIGAFDGVNYDTFVVDINKKEDNSNTKIVFVEPIPEYFEKLKENLVQFNVPVENISLENCCVGDTNCEVDMVYFNPKSEGNRPWYIDGCSCVVEDGRILNMHIREEIPTEDLLFIKSPAVTVHEVLQKNNLESIDYIQIDTEGYDERIVKSMDFAALGVKYLKFELYYCDTDWVEKIIAEADSMGYYYHRDWDLHLIRKDLVDELSQ